MVKRAERPTKASPEPPEPREPGLLREFGSFLWQHKLWWLLPIFLVLFLFGVLILVTGTGLAPFLYDTH